MKIRRDSNLPESLRDKLGQFYANCMEIKSYVDRPRGTAQTYKRKMLELMDTGTRLASQLRIQLGIPEDKDEE